MEDCSTLAVCTECGVAQPLSDEFFEPRVPSKTGFRRTCRQCKRERENARNRAKPKRPKPVYVRPAEKACTLCGVVHPNTTDFFYANKSRDGTYPHCKACHQGYVKRWYASEKGVEFAAKKSKKRWQRVKSDPALKAAYDATAAARRASEKGKAYSKAYYKGYYQRTRADQIAYSKAWSLANPERAKARVQKWKRENIEQERWRGRLKNSRRRAQAKAAGGTFTRADVERQYNAQDGKCYWCRAPLEVEGRNRYHADHLIALNRGGSNGPENIVCACPSCNSSKRDLLPHEWNGRLL